MLFVCANISHSLLLKFECFSHKKSETINTLELSLDLQSCLVDFFLKCWAKIPKYLKTDW